MLTTCPTVTRATVPAAFPAVFTLKIVLSNTKIASI